jgi:hypothetical protein
VDLASIATFAAGDVGGASGAAGGFVELVAEASLALLSIALAA